VGTIDEDLGFGFDALLDAADTLVKNLTDQAAQELGKRRHISLGEFVGP
jgi:hypothetical protein